MYLSRQAVMDTFHLISDHSYEGSLVVFDYIYASVLRRENRYYGENAIYQRVKKDYEQWVFGIEEGELTNFLTYFNFSLVEELNSYVLENKYFKNEAGKIITRINGTHCIVLAKREKFVSNN